ncbi:MAG: hypothetical protein H0W61_02975 [Bacteroidetes bacterium]|nr:hypothetical protein [Bacteroidota bacterium]
MKLIKFSLYVLSFLVSSSVMAQDDLLDMVDDPAAKKKKEFVSATFKGTRLINFHTVEVPGKDMLEFRISHHFGDFNSGGYNFWGLDGGATIRLALEYSRNGRFAVGFGRSSLDKTFDGFFKYKLLKQTVNGSQPVTITLFSGAYYATIKDPNMATAGYDKYQYQSSRLSYCHQIIIARKFTERLSIQIAPTLVHYNLVDFATDKNDLFVIATATRFKYSKRGAITFEYAYRVNEASKTKYYDSVGLGIDLETGGHVFQMFVTNSAGMLESQFFGRTTSSWQNWGLKLGFNISRMFYVGGRKAAN